MPLPYALLEVNKKELEAVLFYSAHIFFVSARCALKAIEHSAVYVSAPSLLQLPYLSPL